jgi:outer membrane scaffolding protein for murein synthesis (MipA/OmpV family)
MTHTKRLRRLACLVPFFWLAAVRAQSAELPLWEVGIAGAALTTPAYPGSSQATQLAIALPYVIYRGDVLRIGRSGFGATLVDNGDFEFDVGFSGSLPASSQEITARQGMPDLGALVEFGPRAKLTLARLAGEASVRLEVPLRAVVQVTGGLNNRGTVLAPKLVFETRDQMNGWRFAGGIGVTYADQALGSYFYGVPAAFATPQRPAYEARGGLLGTALTLDASRSVGPNVRFFSYLRYENYAGSANAQSPLMKVGDSTSAGLAVAWIWGRSETMVPR